MATHLAALLNAWYPLRDTSEWVLGTVYQTDGPCYRKAGAMMLFSADGQQLGMLSGGCLESDIHRHARRVMYSGQAETLTYDGSDEDDLSFQLGIGCGGTVHILLQPLSRANNYLQLADVIETLNQHQSGHYYQLIPHSTGEVSVRFIASETVAVRQSTGSNTELLNEGGEVWLHTRIIPPHHLLIVGGGIDARPVAAIGQELGWQISVWDPRPANARPEYFPSAYRLLQGDVAELPDYVRKYGVNAAVLMSHHIELDAQALAELQACRLQYMALLGPTSRRDRVLAKAGIRLERCRPALAGPAGLDIGADLPETIALSILAECQAVLQHRSGQALNRVLAA